MAEEVVVGGYRRLSVMQTGQTSEVWVVAEAGTEQRYAMKLLLAEKVGKADQRKLLFHEASIAQKFDHPRIIRVFKLVRGKQPFILMEYFPSQNLKLRLMRNEYDDFIKPRLRGLLDQIADAIDYVHQQRWVHRDIKPDNVLVNAAGQIRLIDFALAVRPASFFGRVFGRKGKTAGTRSYMSPEQIRGLPLDRRADVYSFGVMIFEIVNGRLPFVGNSSNDLLRKHLTADVPAFDPARNVTRDFELLVREMMAKVPGKRLPSVAEFRERLRTTRIFNDEKISAPARAGGYS